MNLSIGFLTRRRLLALPAIAVLCVGGAWFLLAQDATPPGPEAATVPAPETPTVVRGYPVAPEALSKVAEELQRRFPPETGVRVAADARTSQIVVAAPEETQVRITQLLRDAAQPQTAPPAAPATTKPGAGYALQNITVQELEDGLLRIWGQRLTRTVSPNGETVVLHVAAESGAQPVLHIDRRAGSVAFLTTPGATPVWQRVIEALDRPRGGANPETELVPVQRADPAKVQRAVELLQSSMEAAPAGAPTRLASAPLPQEAAPATAPADAAPPPAAPPAAAPEANGTAVLPVGEEGGLLGPVQIEFLEGLDVIVLRGHKRDVERVQRIIGDIERLSVETQPQIELIHLAHVGSQAMNELVGDIYNEILSPRQGQVTIRALVKPNSLLLIGRPESVNVVRQLIGKLDQPVEPETQFQVFQLQHISALDAEETINNFFVDRLGQSQQQGAQQAQQGRRPGLGTRVNVVSEYRSNSLIVQAGPRDMEEVRRLIAQIDVESTAAANELRIFKLKNALATDIAPVLQDAINWQLVGNRTPLGATRTGTFGGGQTFGQTEERARVRSAIIKFMTVDASGSKVVESGLLSEVRVTADTNSNALVVTGPPKSMGLIEALINELDQLPSAQAQIKVFTIVNGDAQTLSSMLQQLLGQTGQTTQQNVLFGQGTVSPFLAAAMQSAAAAGESTLVPVRFGVDQRTNSIIATGSDGDLGVVEAILMRLDEERLLQHKTMVYWLANTSAEDVATALNDWIEQRASLFNEQLDITPESPQIQWNRRVIVVPETISNTIIISAAPELFDEVKHVVESLDRRPPLIKIDVLIAQVGLSDVFELGAEYGIQDSLLFDRSYNSVNTTKYGAAPGYNFNNVPLGDSASLGQPNVLGQALTSFGLGRLSAGQGYGGLVLSASSEAVSVLIRALQEQGRAQVLSRPTVTTLDKQPAFINIGATVSRLAGTTQNNNSTTQDVEDVETGLTLGVTPQVTPDGTVVMEIDATKSKLSSTEGVELPDGFGGTFFQGNIDQVVAQTTVSGRSGQTIVFAGLIETTDVDVVKGIPFLSDLPVVGGLFRLTEQEEKRTELLIILTPHVIYGSDEEHLAVRRAESERMSWCLADVMALYGDAGMTARPGDWCGCPTETQVIFPALNPTGLGPAPGAMPVDGELLPTPLQPTSGQMRILEPGQPAATVTPAPPVANAGYQPAPNADGYPGATMGYAAGPQPSPYAAPAAEPAYPYSSARDASAGP